jgi:transmembrane sensor
MMKDRLHYLFRQYFEKAATPEEIAELMSRLSEDASEEEILSLMDETWEGFTSPQPVFADEKSQQMLQYALQAPEQKQPVIIKRWRSVAAAAAVLLLLFSTGYLLLKKEPVASPQATLPQPVKFKNDITPAKEDVVLTLANGARIVLDDASNGNLASQGGVSVIKQNGQLSYAKASGKSASAAVYNSIATARGKQYMVVLSDGTKVWLNAASVLRYPAVFDVSVRRGELSGEAYFEVTHTANKKVPFIVATVPPSGGRSAEIMVLGTHFNINAYNDEALVKTTLLEGSVRISTTADTGTKTKITTVLTPGQQAQLSHLSDHGSIHLVKEANVHQTMAWKNELFDFENETIRDIMRQLSRWYDIDVEFKGEISEKHYYGAIRRQVNISEVFKMLEIAGNVSFSINGKKVYIQQK